VDPASDEIRTARDLGITFAAADGSDDEAFERRRLHGAP
jgi:hypothetical protein